MPRTSSSAREPCGTPCRRRDRRLRGRDVLGPPRAVERAARPFRPCLDLAGRGPAGHPVLDGRRHGAGPALPPCGAGAAVATLGELFPDRFWAALGTGEAINEHVTGDRVARQADPRRAPARMRRRHPRAPARRGGHASRPRQRRSRSAVEPAPSPAEAVRRRGGADRARCRLVGGRADHGQPTRARAPARDRGVQGGRRRGQDRRAQVHLSWDVDDDTALAIAHDQWRTNVFGSSLVWNLEFPSNSTTRLGSSRRRRGSAVLVSSDPATRRVAPTKSPISASSSCTCTTSAAARGFIEAFGERSSRSVDS